MFGTICAIIAGAQMPLFALGVSQALVAYYMDWDTTQREVKKITILFCCAAVITVIVHAIEHLSFGIMGERLTLRVREKMFSGKLISKGLHTTYVIVFSFTLAHENGPLHFRQNISSIAMLHSCLIRNLSRN